MKLEPVELEMKSHLTRIIVSAMKKQKMSQSELARRMVTSRAVVHRLLKPADTSVTLTTAANALTALGLRCKFVARPSTPRS